MTKLLIVDDDLYIREGIKRLIDWDELGIEIVGAAEGGHEALRLAEELHPHIVLTDIRMPQGDGLELIERIRGRGWNMQIVVLSGYNDYAYVRQAMKHQVEDYLLKPVDAGELGEIMKSCRERTREMWLEEQLKRESFQLLLNNVLMRWMENRIHADQLREKLQFLGFDTRRTDLFQAAVITWTGWDEGSIPAAERQFRSFAIWNSMDEALRESGRGIAFVNQDRHVVCLLLGHSGHGLGPDEFAADNLRWLQERSARYAQLLKTPWNCTLGGVRLQAQSVHESYRDALRLQEYTGLTAGPHCADAGCVVPRSGRGPAPDADDRDNVVNALLGGNRELLLEALADDFVWAAEQADPLAAAKYAAATWLILLKQALKRKGLAPHEHMPESQAASALFAMPTVGEIRARLLQLLNETGDRLAAASPKPGNPIAELAQSYIRDHYAEELSLQLLAARLNVNANYLGRLFKEETGHYFSDYVNRVRLDHARRLLETTHAKASEIAALVGFPDANYFFRKFKMMTGVSPTEYRGLPR